jgi:hypothetical protein
MIHTYRVNVRVVPMRGDTFTEAVIITGSGHGNALQEAVTIARDSHPNARAIVPISQRRITRKTVNA